MKLQTILGIALVFGFAAGVVAKDKHANSDQTTRTVSGVVTDSAKQPVNGASVQLKDTKSLQIRSFRTEADGAYHFAGLSTNVDYELKAEHNGKWTGSKTLSNFDGRKAPTVGLRFK